MDRITDRDLQRLVNEINELTGSPMQPWGLVDDTGCKANVGNYHIDSAYGGVKLVRMSNESGGVSEVDGLRTGFTTKRDLYNRLQAFIGGLKAQGE